MRFLLILSTLLTLSFSQPRTITITPGENVASIVNGAPEGSTVRIEAGRYFISEPLRPRARVTIEGVGTVTIHGSRLLENWRQIAPNHFEVGGQRQQGERYTNSEWQVCETTHPRCAFPDDVYFNGTPLRHVASISQLAPGAFFFDYERNVIAIGSDPSGAVLEAAITPFAVQTSAAGVILRNLTFEKFATPTERAAIELSGSGARVENVTVRLVHGNGVIVRDGGIVRGSRLVDNGQSGGGAAGVGGLYEDNVISGNNYARHAKSFSAGGFSKAARTTGFVFRRNQVFDNLGDGIWADVDNRDLLIEGNTVYGNLGTGIFHEIGYSARIVNNVVYCNDGYGQINITSSLGSADNPILIAGNQITVCDGKGEALAIRRDGGRPDRFTDWVTVVGNAVYFRDGRGKVILDAWGGVSLGQNINFSANTFYTLAAEARHWRYDNADREWSAWVGRYPLDVRVIGMPQPGVTVTATATIVPTASYTNMPTRTHTPTPTATRTASPTATATPTITLTKSHTPTPTMTITLTPEETKTPTAEWVQVGVWRITVIVERLVD